MSVGEAATDEIVLLFQSLAMVASDLVINFFEQEFPLGFEYT